jgi:uncharacterized SAM-binding protein YcdF (DUF218 family)
MAFALSKLLWSLLSPGSLLVLLLLLGLALNASNNVTFVKTGRALSLFVGLCFALLALLPVGEWALIPLENRFSFVPQEQIDGIIVLGGDENTKISETRGMPTALDSVRRYVTFADMARRYPDARLVFSGGSASLRPHEHVLDSDVARDFLSDIGVPTENMTFEKTSRNTYENAVFSADIVRPDPSQKWLLVTSAWHMTRAIGCFRKAGWNVYPAPTGYFTTGNYHLKLGLGFAEELHLLSRAVHEYVGLVAYYLMGRTSALWPG